jgi:hypothetical protein
MSNDTNNYFQSFFGKPQTADELHRAGMSNPSYIPNYSDFSSNEARTAFQIGQDSAKKSGS